MKFYSGDIMPEPGTVFVFGSNTEGRHGAGAARVAREQFGAVYGRAEGLQGNAYAIATKDLKRARELGIYTANDKNWNNLAETLANVYGGGGYRNVCNGPGVNRSIPAERIIGSIVKMYECAAANPGKKFKVAYTIGLSDISLCGYCGGELAAMYEEAGRRFGGIPENVYFSQNWKAFLTQGFTATKSNMSDRISFTSSLIPGYRQRTIDNALASDITLAYAVDFSTVGERLTASASGDRYRPVPFGNDFDKILSDTRKALGPVRTFSSVNIAGNGLATLSLHGISQESCNNVLIRVFRELLKEGYRFREIRSGGQTGMDEAGIAAAVANGLKATVHASANWKWRDSQGTDHYGEAEFRSRFDRYVSKAPAKEQHASTGKPVEKKKKYSLKKSF